MGKKQSQNVHWKCDNSSLLMGDPIFVLPLHCQPVMPIVRKKEEDGTMRILRWIAFLPTAAIVGLMAGKLGNILGVLVSRGKP